MNSVLCAILFQLCFIISNTGSVKYYVLHSISDDRKLDKPTPDVILLRIHQNHSLDPWKVNKKPMREPSEKHSLTTEQNLMQSERNILNGKVLRATFNARLLITRNFLTKICESLQRIGNFTIKNITEGINHPGFFNKTTQTWHGGISLLQNGRVDISSSLYSASIQKREIVDLSVALVTAKMCLLIKRPEHEVILQRSGYLKPFAIKTWCGMVLLLFAATVLLTFMKKKAVKKLHYGSYIPEQFLQLWGTLCQQGLADFPRISSYKIAYYAILVFGIIIYTIYSTLLVSDIINIEKGLPFSSLEEFAQHKLYRLAILKDSPLYPDITGLKYYPFNLLKKKVLKYEDLPTTHADLNDMVCQKKVAAAVYNLYINLFKELLNNCSLVHICSSWSTTSLSLAFQKNSPYTQALNYNILRLKSQGILDHMYKTFFGEIKKYSTKEDTEATFTGVTFVDIFTLLAITLGSFVLPLIVLLLEKVHFWFYEKQTAVIRIAAGLKAK